MSGDGSLLLLSGKLYSPFRSQMYAGQIFCHEYRRNREAGKAAIGEAELEC